MADEHRKASALALLLGLVVSGCNVYAQTSPNDSLEHYAETGEKALAEGRYADAEKAYEELRRLSPGTAEVHARLGLIYFQERKFDQAVASMREAFKLKPSLPKLDTLLAMSLSELGRYTEALAGLEKGFQQGTDTAVRRRCGLELIRAYTGSQRDSKAMEVALQLNRLYPDDPEVLFQTGKIYGNLAYLTMHKLAQVAPDSVWRHEAAAEAFESEGASEFAIPEYQKVLALDPHRPGVHYRLGRTLLARSEKTKSPEDIQEAAKEFELELGQEPANANAAYELAEIHRNAGEAEEARKYFEMALKHYPNFEEAHLGLASVLVFEHKPDLALPHLQKAIALNPDNRVSWYRLVQAERALGNGPEEQKALQEFQRLRKQQASEQAAHGLFAPQEVTPQKLDPDAAP
jgi:tetratricopeptide (TPR) repeat protein